MSFIQDAPRLSNPFHSDRVLMSWLRRHIGPRDLPEWERELGSFGALIEKELYPQQLTELALEPELIQFDAWGQRIDQIKLTPLWERLKGVAAQYGLVATGYEREHAAQARMRQFALVYLFTAASDFYSCPLAMTDGAARALLDSRNDRLIARAVPRLLSRDPLQCWTSGQWMTETTGGSDVSRTETIARMDDAGQWRVYGRKWFTSAATSEMAVLLARPESGPPGAEGLALFYIEPRDAAGVLQGVRIDRLKHKMGTRKLPTAELTLDGAPVQPVGALTHGIRSIAPVLNITRLWNAVAALSLLRRGLQLARDYAERREAFGKPLLDQPLHQQTLGDVQAQFEAGFHLTFLAVELLGRQEHGELNDQQKGLLRVLTPLVKLLTAKQAIAGLSEVLEAFGGAGYIEWTGIPTLLRDVQVLSIWEGTTNVLSLDVLRVLAQTGLTPVQARLRTTLAAVGPGPLAESVTQLKRAFEGLNLRISSLMKGDRETLESNARAIALSLARILAGAELLKHADWAMRAEADPRPAAAARRFVAMGLVEAAVCEAEDRQMLGTDRHPGR
jgi:alkylation response protein AidB-like acyl-CoA dehydrogenase